MIASGQRAAPSRVRGARQTKKRARGAIRADINVTPLVDVVLVLLIIFMVVTPMLSKGVNVDLPLTKHHDKRNDDNRDVIVAITHQGEIYVGSDPVTLERVGEAVANERRRHPDKGIFLKGDARLGYGTARRVMEAIHRSGVEQIQLGTEEAATTAPTTAPTRAPTTATTTAPTTAATTTATTGQTGLATGRPGTP